MSTEEKKGQPQEEVETVTKKTAFERLKEQHPPTLLREELKKLNKLNK